MIGTCLIVRAAGTPPAAAQSSRFAGVIEEVACVAELMEVSKKIQQLPRGRGLDLPVSVGERLRCTGRGTMTVALPGVSPAVISSRDKWVTVREGPLSRNILEFSDARVTRAPVPLVFSPLAHGWVSAERATIRWRPLPDMENVTFNLRVRGSVQPLCCKATHSGAAGVLDSAELRDALRAHRNRRSARELDLTMRDAQGNTNAVSFFVLSAARESELEQKLARWAASDAIVRHLGRAAVFSEFRLRDDAWQETEAALKESSDSPWLIQLATRAANRAQHIQRADQLAERLKDVKRNP